MIGLTDTRALVGGEPRTTAIVSALPVAGPLVTTSVDAGRHRRGDHHSSRRNPIPPVWPEAPRRNQRGAEASSIASPA